MNFIEHLKQASRTVASWPKWKRECLGRIEPEISSLNDYRGWMVVELGRDGSVLLENKIGTRRRVELVDIDKIVQERYKEELELKDQQYVELACAVWRQTDAEFLESPADHAETCTEAQRGAHNRMVDDSVYRAIVHLSAASTELKQAYRAITGEQA